MSSLPSQKRKLFTILCVCCMLVPLLYAVASALRASAPAPVERTVALMAPETLPVRPSAQPAETAKSAAPAQTRPSQVERVLFYRNTAMGDSYGKLAVSSLDALDRPVYSRDLDCDRVYFAAGHGVCLTSDRGVFTTYSAVLFDARLRAGRTLPLNGTPSRVRVSSSGRLASITVFLTGQSYAALNLSTQTTIVDLVRGEVLIPDLETLSVWRDGAVFRHPDFNFWGVTFARDENRFYATLWSQGTAYLIEGDLGKRTARVIHQGVECPSLSPDNTRVAYKKRFGSSANDWRIHLLELKTMTDRALGETRSVDDQMEWLDDEHILYAMSDAENGSSASTDLWQLSTSPEDRPRLFMRGAFSPAVAPAQQSVR
ncbi:MAG: hypothetical protein QOJ99_2009 [Bryobacterales bacterium]|nr:hypothetical protein [Bryobacterales bacterium]